MKIHLTLNLILPYGRKDGQTDRTKLIVAFSKITQNMQFVVQDVDFIC